MLKKIATLVVFAAAFGTAVATAHANTIAGRVTSFTPTSIAVVDKEVVTVGMNADTEFTRLIVAKPWQADTALTFSALRVGRYVVVHADWGIANWVQVDMDRPVSFEREFTFTPVTVLPLFVTEAARHRVEAATLRAAPNASESKRPGSPGTAAHCDRMAARLDKAAGVISAPPADVAANPAPAAPESARHRAEAAARRAAPNASESKRPGSPDTALHCDRMADTLEKAVK